ncbi:MAG: acyltransferase [Clostridia bacterium]|nr:acyltransferase [Clostridia bacterium]
MQKITSNISTEELQNGNRILGTFPEMVNSSIVFSGKGNVVFCEKGVKLINTSIIFNADNSIVYLCENKHDYKLNITLYNDNVFYSGKNNYFNGVLNIILSEQKHFIVGNNCLISFGIWVRNADPHLIYDVSTKKRVNPTKSIFIGDHVWLGQSAMILKGTEIESGSIIGAMSVVSGKKIPNNTLWAGNPAKKIKEQIFWDGSCVHSWTKDKTKKSQHNSDKSFIYNHKSREYVSFDDIDKNLDADHSIEKKINILTDLSLNTDKNRFVRNWNGVNETEKNGLFSKFRQHTKG